MVCDEIMKLNWLKNLLRSSNRSLGIKPDTPTRAEIPRRKSDKFDLQKDWKNTTIIMLVFALTGTTSMRLTRPALTHLFGLDGI